jgi:hypothetical protein
LAFSLDVPETGLLCDLLWSDPNPSIDYWDSNDRGVSYTFGKEAVKSFCEQFKIELVCRAHQVVEDGYEFFANQRLITLFTAPNYGGEFDNSAALMTVDMNLQCSLQVLRPNNSLKSHKGRGLIFFVSSLPFFPYVCSFFISICVFVYVQLLLLDQKKKSDPRSNKCLVGSYFLYFSFLLFVFCFSN